ncbi:hypothetical protein WDU94_006074 [Cyamophila willieti]
MAVSNVLFIVLLGLCGAAWGYNDNSSTTAGLTTLGSGGNGTTPAGEDEDCLTEAEETKICEVKPGTGNSTSSTSAPPALCAAAGPTDDFCSKLAASVNGTSPCCVAVHVCSFKVSSSNTNSTGSDSTGSTIAGTGHTTAGTGSTTAGIGSTTAGTGSTVGGTGHTTGGTGSPADSAIVPEPNTAYISCDKVPAGFEQVKTCPSSKIIFVYPSSGSSGSTPAGTGSTHSWQWHYRSWHWLNP